jgi:hypothetical protein
MRLPRARSRLGTAFAGRAVLVALAIAFPVFASAEADSAARPSIVLTQLPLARPGNETGLPPGSRIVLVDRSGARERVSVLTSEFVSAGRPSLSPDARRILFVARKTAAEPLSVWELELATGGKRRVTGCDGDCTRAIYASVLYTMDLDEPAPIIVVSTSSSNLYAVRLDGSASRRISYNPLGAGHPLLLRDGRLVYSSGTGDEKRSGAALFTIFTDGTDVFPFTADPPSGVNQTMACESAGGEVIFVESDPRDALSGGALVAVPATRSRTGRRAVAASSGGRFHSPSPLPDGSLLVAWRPERAGSYGVYRLDPRSGSPLEPVFDAKDFEDLDPVAVVPSPDPAGHSSVVKDEAPFGELYCLDAGSPAAYLNVVRAPEGAAGEALLGRVPLEADGSFHLRIPSRTPLRLETLDAAGNPIRAMRSWIWVMPNEKRGCIGCHEDRDLAPPNRHVLALRRPPRSVGVAEPAQVKSP